MRWSSRMSIREPGMKRNETRFNRKTYEECKKQGRSCLNRLLPGKISNSIKIKISCFKSNINEPEHYKNNTEVRLDKIVESGFNCIGFFVLKYYKNESRKRH